MGDPSLELQAAIRDCLIASSDVTALVPADNIVDRAKRPELDRVILVGDGSTQPGDRYQRFYTTAFADLHIWVKELNLIGSKQIGSAIIDALDSADLDMPGYAASGLRVLSTRYIRDPYGEYSHGIISLRVNIQGRAA